MSENEIALIYTMFINKFNGKTFGEVIPDIYETKCDIGTCVIRYQKLIPTGNFSDVQWVLLWADYRNSFVYSDKTNKKSVNIDLVELIGEVKDLI